MADLTWGGMRKIRDLLAEGLLETVVVKVDFAISAALETISDVLPTATEPLLRDGAAEAKAALQVLASKAELQELSADFLAGRLSAAVDVLGYAASQTGDEAILEMARRQPYAKVLGLLHERPLRNADLVICLAKDKGYISRLLDELEAVGAVTSHHRGRERFNALSPVGRLVVEQGLQDQRRTPLAESNLYDLGARRPGLDVEPGTLTRLSACG